MKLNKKNIIFLLFFISLLSLNSIATQPELTFNLHTTFVEEISYIKGTDKVLSGSRSGRVAIKSISGTEEAKICELGEWIYQLSHVEGTNYILAAAGNTKIYRFDYTAEDCDIVSVNAISANKLIRSNNANVPAGKIYYYFISR
jgi:hypothetical protein